MYTFHYGGQDGQEYQLVEANDLVVVRTREDAPLQDISMSGDARSLVPSLLPVASFPEAQVTVYKVMAPDALKMRNEVRRCFKQEENIRFAGRALRDQKTGTIFVYTENFFIKFKDEVKPERCAALLADYQLTVKETLPFAPNSFFVQAKEGTGLGIFAMSNGLLNHEEVEFCHPELVMEKRNRFVHPSQWHLKRTTINGEIIDQNIDIENAWGLTQGEGITIAVIDDGMDYDHPEFAVPGKVVFPRDTVRNTDDARPVTASDNHGTACAGVACAAGIDKASGVAPKARLMPIRTGGLGSLAEAKAFAWAADKGADVISCSWGPRDGDWWNPGDPLHTTAFSLPDSTRLALEYALTKGRGGKGCVIVWAAGNGNEDVRYDGYASYPGIIAVAACNDRGSRSVYSDYGAAVWCAFPSNDFYVPQFNHPRPLSAGIWTTDRRGRLGYNPGGNNAESLIGDLAGLYTATFGGTSSACPGVAGVAALVLSMNPGLTAAQVKQLLRDACDKIDPVQGNYDATGHSIYYGYGRVNAAQAVRLAQTTLTAHDDFQVSGVAYFTCDSVVPITNGVFTQDQSANNRLTGIRLKIDPLHPGLRIQYRVFVQRLGATNFVMDGEWTGTLDKRRKIVGVQMQLLGSLADEYQVQYQVKLQGRSTPEQAADGKVAGTSSKSGRAIEEIQVQVKKRK